MVQSILVPSITYSETQKIQESDIDYDANLYQSEIYEKEIIFAIGKQNYKYIDNNIVYYSIYMIDDNDKKKQIGVYEIQAGNQEQILDSDGDIDLNEVDAPLLYSFAYSLIHGEPEESVKEKKDEKRD